ncbi:MAG: hypothetical protein PHV78_01220 [Patescibacteria group bacterium]|nr:hypothetical protein [Patescibacteria group bacterium]MDD5121221.1 hypothetical protein [Patescibacteria group bacterium]MDD5221750.1 hypothetical protein [Patescibacteria group bacterium]MDD5395860.1 hypothetical protein [Patescibacteria group bacterium]
MNDRVNPKIKQFLQRYFGGTDLASIMTFLDKGFSLNGQVVVSTIFVSAQECRVPVTRVLAECEKEWDRNWNFQHPELRGNPDAPGGAGMQNRASLEKIYTALGIPSPREGRARKRV